MKMNKKGRRTGITMNKKLGSTLIAMTIIIFMLFLTLGMFTKNFGGSASAEVAAPHTSIVGGRLETNNADGSVDEGQSGTYTFSVKNTDKDNGDKVSEVSLKYKLHIETNEDYDGNVEYKLYRVDGENKTEITNTETDEDNKVWYIDDSMKFGVEENAQVHNYELEFTPDSAGEFNFKVKVKAEQID